MRPHILLAIIVLGLAGCVGDPAPNVTAPILPGAPTDFGKPVAVRAPKVGEDARVYAARERAGRLTANQRLVNDAAFYADVVSKFGASAH
jgi:hypothetical protein